MNITARRKTRPQFVGYRLAAWVTDEPDPRRQPNGHLAEERLYRTRVYACYVCDTDCDPKAKKCWRCGSVAFYRGVRPTRVFCPPDDPVLSNGRWLANGSWTAFLKIMGQR